jgi:hypothetical protein
MQRMWDESVTVNGDYDSRVRMYAKLAYAKREKGDRVWPAIKLKIHRRSMSKPIEVEQPI